MILKSIAHLRLNATEVKVNRFLQFTTYSTYELLLNAYIKFHKIAKILISRIFV